MRKINTTIELDEKRISFLEMVLRSEWNVVDFKILPQTEKLYEENKHFRNLIKQKKQLQREIDLYINKHN